MESFKRGDRVWVFTDDDEWIRGTVSGPREMLVMWMGNGKIASCYSVECDRGGTWPIGEENLRLMNPLDVLAEIE